jgi:hypothetical protein
MISETKKKAVLCGVSIGYNTTERTIFDDQAMK